jgi:hypothetical protein
VSLQNISARLMCALAFANDELEAQELQLLREVCATRGLDLEALRSEAMSRRGEPLWFLAEHGLSEDDSRTVLIDAMVLAFTGEDYTPAKRQLLRKAAVYLDQDFIDQLPTFGDSLGDQDRALVHNRLLDIHNPYHRELAARLLRTQGCMAAQLSTTYALVTRATPADIAEMNVHKGRGRDRVATLLVSPETLPALCAQVDVRRVRADLKNLAQHPTAVRYLSGALLVRLPVVPDFRLRGQSADAAFLSEAADGRWVQLLCPADPSTLAFVRAAETSAGLLAATSMNDSSIGEMTITHPRRALEFCQARGISLAILDRPVSQGSFKIMMLSQSGVTIERDGRSADVGTLLAEAQRRATHD